MRHCDRTGGKKTPLGSRPLVRGSTSLTGGPGQAVVLISGRERITDQVMTLQNELNFILSSASDHQEQEAFLLTGADLVCCQLGLKSPSNGNHDFDRINECECP